MEVNQEYGILLPDEMLTAIDTDKSKRNIKSATSSVLISFYGLINKMIGERSFAIGEKVWLKLQPYVQTSVASRASHKLSFKYFGPYAIQNKIGSIS